MQNTGESSYDLGIVNEADLMLGTVSAVSLKYFISYLTDYN